MSKIEVSIFIKSSVDKVWDIISDMDNETKYWKGTKEKRFVDFLDQKELARREKMIAGIAADVRGIVNKRQCRSRTRRNVKGRRRCSRIETEIGAAG